MGADLFTGWKTAGGQQSLSLTIDELEVKESVLFSVLFQRGFALLSLYSSLLRLQRFKGP